MGVSRGGPVLTTDDVSGWNRAALAAVRALAGTPYRPVVSVSGPVSLAASSRWCTEVVRVPAGGRPGYAEALRRAVDDGGYAAVLPASDVALLALHDPSARLVDKEWLAPAALAAGLESLPGEVFDDLGALRRAAGRIGYPAIVKSVVKSGVENLQAVRVDSADDVEALAAGPGAVLVQPFVAEPMRAVSGVVWDGRLLAVCHQRYRRLWPRQAGVAAAAETVLGDPALEEKVRHLLAGHRGVFQVQLLGPYLVDVNPRVYGSMQLAVAAGANLPLIACEAAGGCLPGTVVRARPGVRYRWLEGDVRNLADGLRHGGAGWSEVVARLRERRAAYSVESLHDPRPAWTRLRGVVLSRARSGGGSG